MEDGGGLGDVYTPVSPPLPRPYVPHKRLCSERSKSPLTNIPPSGGKGKTISPHSTLQVSETRFLKPKEFSFTLSFHRLTAVGSIHVHK